MILIFSSFFSIPLEITFLNNSRPYFYKFLFTMYIADLLLKFNIPYYEKGSFIKKRVMIVYHTLSEQFI